MKTKNRISEFIATTCFNSQNPFQHKYYNLLVKAIREKLVEIDRMQGDHQTKPNPKTIVNTINLLLNLDFAIASQLDFDDLTIESNGSISVDIFKNKLGIYFSIGDNSFNYFTKNHDQVIAEEENILFIPEELSELLQVISHLFLQHSLDSNISAYYNTVVTRQQTSYISVCYESNFMVV